MQQTGQMFGQRDADGKGTELAVGMPRNFPRRSPPQRRARHPLQRGRSSNHFADPAGASIGDRAKSSSKNDKIWSMHSPAAPLITACEQSLAILSTCWEGAKASQNARSLKDLHDKYQNTYRITQIRAPSLHEGASRRTYLRHAHQEQAHQSGVRVVKALALASQS